MKNTLAKLSLLAGSFLSASAAQVLAQDNPTPAQVVVLDECEPDRDVGMFLTRLGSKPVEQCHTRSSLTRAASACELGHPKFVEPRHDVAAVRGGMNLFVNRKNAAVGADVKSPP